jgi:deoxycytidine triphosphate deaminase
MMMSDEQILAAVKNGEIALDPFDPRKVRPASYDARVGTWAFSSSSKSRSSLQLEWWLSGLWSQ